MAHKDILINKNTSPDYPDEVNDFIINGTQDDIEVCVTNIEVENAKYKPTYDSTLAEGDNCIIKEKGQDGRVYFISTFLLTNKGREFMYSHKVNIPAEHGLKIIGTGKLNEQ